MRDYNDDLTADNSMMQKLQKPACFHNIVALLSCVKCLSANARRGKEPFEKCLKQYCQNTDIKNQQEFIDLIERQIKTFKEQNIISITKNKSYENQQSIQNLSSIKCSSQNLIVENKINQQQNRQSDSCGRELVGSEPRQKYELQRDTLVQDQALISITFTIKTKEKAEEFRTTCQQFFKREVKINVSLQPPSQKQSKQSQCEKKRKTKQIKSKQLNTFKNKKASSIQYGKRWARKKLNQTNSLENLKNKKKITQSTQRNSRSQKKK